MQYKISWESSLTKSWIHLVHPPLFHAMEQIESELTRILPDHEAWAFNLPEKLLGNVNLEGGCGIKLDMSSLALASALVLSSRWCSPETLFWLQVLTTRAKSGNRDLLCSFCSLSSAHTHRTRCRQPEADVFVLVVYLRQPFCSYRSSGCWRHPPEWTTPSFSHWDVRNMRINPTQHICPMYECLQMAWWVNIFPSKTSRPVRDRKTVHARPQTIQRVACLHDSVHISQHVSSWWRMAVSAGDHRPRPFTAPWLQTTKKAA